MSRPLDPYLRFFERLSPETVGELDALVTPDVRFRDPFNDTTGVDAMRRAMAKMFEDVESPRFVITHAADAGGGVCLIRWDFTCTFMGRTWQIPGSSELHVAADGRVSAHLDHWDSGRFFYEKLPLLGAVVRFVRRRCAA